MRKYILLLLGCLCHAALSAQTVYSGRVLSENGGTPLAGVLVQEKGANNGVVTGVEGNFTITTTRSNPELVFTYIGMLNTERRASANMVVRMRDDLMQMDEVIVTAYGVSKKASFTGSAAVIDSKKIESMQVSSLTQLLQGAATGVQVSETNGQPGSDASVTIRGIASLNAQGPPLYVVDGAPYGGNINSINPGDIESMTVLKDAAATALYGSRAIFGVIMITTKRGKAGAPQFNFNLTLGSSSLAVPMGKTLSTGQYHEMAWEALRNGYMDNPSLAMTQGQANHMATQELVGYLGVDAYGNPNPVGIDGKLADGSQLLWGGNNWRDALIQNRLRSEYNASVTGATDKSNYYMSLGYLDDKGILTVSEFKRYSGRVNVSTEITDWFDMGMNSSFSHSVTNSPDQGRVMSFARTVSDIYPKYEWDYAKNDYKLDKDGKRILDFGQYRPAAAWQGANPLAEKEYDQRYYEHENVSVRANAGLKLPFGFKFTSNFGVDYSVGSGFYYYNNMYGWSADIEGRSSRDRNRFITYTFNQLLTWDRTYGEHHINVLAGHESYTEKSYFLSGEKEGFPMGGIYELDAAATLKNASSRIDNSTKESWLAKAEYDYDDKYYLSASFRRDGSSQFYKDVRWGNFGSVGVSWRASNEEFMKGIEWINNLKLKASYGTTGNDNTNGIYAWQGLYGTGWNDINNNGYMIATFGAHDLIWESNHQFNIGVDAVLLNRINVSLEWFDRKSYDMLLERSMQGSSGMDFARENIGTMRNRGVELQLNTVNIKTSDFRWETDLNISNVRNKILYLPDGDEVRGAFRWTEGKSAREWHMPEWAGVDPNTGLGLFWKDVVNTDVDGNETVVGRVKTTVYDDATRSYQGSAFPKVTGGFTNNLYYKNFDLSLFLYYSIGGKIYDGNYVDLMHSGTMGVNWSTDILDRWTPENRNTNVPKVSTQSTQAGSQSTRFLYDASYLRLRNVTLGYSLPSKITSKMKIKSLRFYVKADNLFTVTRQKGLDPAVNAGGWASGGLTSVRAISGGLDLKF